MAEDGVTRGGARGGQALSDRRLSAALRRQRLDRRRSSSSLQVAGLDIDYVNRRNALVEAVTVEDIARVAARLLDPDALTFVVVGRPGGRRADQRVNH